MTNMDEHIQLFYAVASEGNEPANMFEDMLNESICELDENVIMCDEISLFEMGEFENTSGFENSSLSENLPNISDDAKLYDEDPNKETSFALQEVEEQHTSDDGSRYSVTLSATSSSPEFCYDPTDITATSTDSENSDEQLFAPSSLTRNGASYRTHTGVPFDMIIKTLSTARDTLTPLAPVCPYSHLIAFVLLDGQRIENKMNVAEIYAAISRNFRGYARYSARTNEGRRWRSGVRHTLASSCAFERVSEKKRETRGETRNSSKSSRGGSRWGFSERAKEEQRVVVERRLLRRKVEGHFVVVGKRK
ncbi:uncharacterized protein V2V93DRAFT_382131 [Kockiozyma suomiensis]|uniref:uncharacterized protein n=1 Tax=Kockiozyma suomiensis TaxID=1337062 RepID=UPI003343DD6F